MSEDRVILKAAVRWYKARLAFFDNMSGFSLNPPRSENNRALLNECADAEWELHNIVKEHYAAKDEAVYRPCMTHADEALQSLEDAAHRKQTRTISYEKEAKPADDDFINECDKLLLDKMHDVAQVFVCDCKEAKQQMAREIVAKLEGEFFPDVTAANHIHNLAVRNCLATVKRIGGIV